MSAAETYLSPKELSERWAGQVKVKTLAEWRSNGQGPTFNKMGGRIIYPLSEVLSYEAKTRFTKIEDYGSKGDES